VLSIGFEIGEGFNVLAIGGGGGFRSPGFGGGGLFISGIKVQKEIYMNTYDITVKISKSNFFFSK
jgi:hypothetical protein